MGSLPHLLSSLNFNETKNISPLVEKLLREKFIGTYLLLIKYNTFIYI